MRHPRRDQLVEIKGPTNDGRSTRVTRVHFDSFWEWCEAEKNPDLHIDAQISCYQEKLATSWKRSAA